MRPKRGFIRPGSARSGPLTTLLTSAVAAALLGGLAVQPDLLGRYAADDMAPAAATGDSYDGFDAKAAEQLRQDQCLMTEVLRMGGPAMYGVAQDGLNQTPDGLHTAADRHYWNETALSTAFQKDRDDIDKIDLYARLGEWKKALSGLSDPGGFQSIADFTDPPGLAGRGENYFQQVGITPWLGAQWWKAEGDYYADPTPKADDATAKAVTDLGTPLYGKSPDPSLPSAEWSRALAEKNAFEDRVFMHPQWADDARIFLSSGGFPRTAPEPGSVEYRIAAEDLKTRFASCDWHSPADPNKVLGKEVSAASAEWQQEIAGQATQRNQILSASKDATKSLATGAAALGEMLGQSWIADHLTRWQDWWSAGGPGWIGDSPFVIHAHGATDKCLEVTGAKKDNGTPVQISTCNGGVGQKWQISGARLYNPNSGKCLAVKGGASANGTAVQISTCDFSASQSWEYGTHGTSRLYNPGTANCLDLADYTNGRDGRMWDCTGKAPQQFDIVASEHAGTGDLDYPTKAQFDKAKKGIADAQAESKKQLDLIKAQAAAAKKAATDSDAATQAAYAVADKAGAPRGRGLLTGQQKAQVTKASAAALDALAKAGDTAYAATRAAAGDSATVAARALTQAAQSKAAFRTAAANEARAQAKAAADAAAVQAQTAKAARDLAKTKLAETRKAEADAKAAAAEAHAKRLDAEAEEATAKAEQETAAAKQAEAARHKQNAQGYATAATEAKGRAETAESTARAKRQDAEAARDRAKGKRDDAWDAESKANAARAKADAKDAYAEAHDSDSDAQASRAAANQADKAADDAEAAASSARAEANAATQAAADADAAATRAEAAAERARSDADAAQAAKLKADAAVRTATSAAADAIKASQTAASAARTAVKLADDADKNAANAKAQADAAKTESVKAVASAADAAGHAYTTAQAAADAGASAQQVAAPANDAVQLGSPYVDTDSAAGLVVLTGQSSKTIAEQQQAVAEAHAANAQKNADQAASLAAAATGDAKAAYTLAAEAASFAAAARKSAKEALGYAAEAAQYAADAQSSLARAIEYDRQAGVDAAAADRAAGRAENYASEARSSADQAALDAEAARAAASEAEQAAKDARAAADRADAEATAAEQAAKDAQAYAESAQQAADQAERGEANGQVQAGAGTGVGGVFYIIDKIAEAAPAKQLNLCDYTLQGCTVTYELHVDVTVSYYFCDNPDVPATESGCPQEDTVFLRTEVLKNQKQEWTHHFTAGDITRMGWQALFGDTLGAVLYEVVLGDAVRCYHGDKVGCAWFASNFIPGKVFTKAAEALRALNVALKTGVGIEDAFKALKALDDIDPATLAKIEDSIRVYEDAVTVCKRNSFPGDTQVLMGDGTRRAIREVREGDLVLAADPGTGRLRPEPVTDTFRHDTDRMTEIAVHGGLLTSTRGHRFYVDGRGWTTVADLVVGDRLRAPDGTWNAVTALTDRPGRAEVFDLTVDDLHTFFVRAQGVTSADVLVHNCLKILDDEANGIGGAHTKADHVDPDDVKMAQKAENSTSGIATRWNSAAIAEKSVNEAFQQWIARNPKGLDSWLTKMRNKFGKNNDRGYFDPRTDLKEITWTLKDAENLGLKWVRNGEQGVDAGNKVVIQLRYTGRQHPPGYVVYTSYLAG
ncbi:ricin-type beta-trefoil lectin domain protein [Streptomyces sp. NPDC049687]|uniref:ricin-type beta-trefoil lectin domain protein n=1 Tax=Streptomyces sp. NPDC049687 TaxID=3365596 RepID=UPI0037911932